MIEILLFNESYSNKSQNQINFFIECYTFLLTDYIPKD
jgi:hypothetical protein